MEMALRVLAFVVIAAAGVWFFVAKPVPFPENDLLRAGVNGGIGGAVIGLGYALCFPRKRKAS